MSPIAPLGRIKAIELVKKGDFPIWFGTPHPFMAIVFQDEKFRIRALEVDPVEATVAGEAAIENGRNWMPEDHYALGKPTGKIFLEASSKKDFLAQMETMTWPEDW
jgi:hypothetical protein